MAGKNASKRARVIDRCLRRGFKRSWQELADACVEAEISESVSERTIKEDIRMLREGDLGFPPAPIKNEQGLYFYTDKDFSISQSPIQDEEAFVLMQALDILNQFPEFEHSEKVQQVVDKLRSALDLSDDESLKDVISFEQTDYPAAKQWISLLYPHLKERNPLSLTYQPFGVEEPFEAKIIPLMLKEFNARWFLIGLELPTNEVKNYALDRIQSFEEYFFDLYKTKIHFDPKSHFNDLVGVSKTAEGPVSIRFQTTPYIANYINTKKIHRSQRMLDASNNTYEIVVHINPELIARLLSFGEDLWVLSPLELVEKIREKVKSMVGNYSGAN